MDAGSCEVQDNSLVDDLVPVGLDKVGRKLEAVLVVAARSALHCRIVTVANFLPSPHRVCSHPSLPYAHKSISISNHQVSERYCTSQCTLGARQRVWTSGRWMGWLGGESREKVQKPPCGRYQTFTRSYSLRHDCCFVSFLVSASSTLTKRSGCALESGFEGTFECRWVTRRC